ncbi:hypothetical protein SDC9_135824 [bioreactor metagenome]|uniref:Uncharacterized protein n=1 Tax=bioreactor metagenome TaxID=1076179 RepID=A0A645DGX0_9ZZZZ
MIRNYFARANLRRFLKRHILIAPWRAHHARYFRLHMPKRALYHIPDAIHHAHVQLRLIAELNFYSFVRHKFRLSRHDRFSGAALRKLVYDAHFDMLIFNIGYNEHIHEFFYKR